MQLFKIISLGFCSLFCHLIIQAQELQYINKIFDYHPAPGQFVNTTFGLPSAAHSIVGALQGGVSLGAYGGYIVVGFEKPIDNNVNNPYGIDFTVFGNANQSSSEAGIVYVMKDENENGLPDDNWYLIAGSDYWFSSSEPDFEITYFNPKDTIAQDVYWEDNLGNVGIIPANEFHTQPYYPLSDSFPLISNDQDKLSGLLVNDRMDNSNPAYIVSQKYSFGFVDNQARVMDYSGWEPDNPYTNEIEGTGGDGIDISWAIDENGAYVNLDEIDFIKIQTGVNALAGWLGEMSTELLGVVDVEVNTTLTGEANLIVIEPIDANMSQGATKQLSAFHFNSGRIQTNESTTWLSSNPEIASISAFGLLETKSFGECTIYAQWDLHAEIKDSLVITVLSETSNNTKLSTDVYLYPNPAPSTVYVGGNSDFSKCTLSNLQGVVVWQSEIFDGKIDIEMLSKGVYIVALYGNEGSISKRIYKN
jgi:hypothetical protein